MSDQQQMHKKEKNKYQDSLNLPKTDFPMKANLANREPKQLAHWQALNVYERLRKQRKNAERFTLHDGPPYANGDIHIGHAVNKILKDIIIKSKSLSGFDAPYVPGWDCHGLPIEWQMEKKVGKVGTQLDAKAFRQACRNYADEQVNKQSKDFIRLGVLGDWEKPYLTKHFAFEAAEIRALAQMIAKGHVERGVRPVYWSIGSASALAEAEVEYETKTSHSIHVAYAAADATALCNALSLPESLPISCLIWTTTPWTLPSSLAISVHPELNYVITKVNQHYYLLAEDLVDSCAQTYGWDCMEQVITVLGAALEGLIFQHPFYQRRIPIVLGEHVTTDSGTGCVHTAPAHGPEDFAVGKRYGLDLHCPVDENGVYLPSVEIYGGQFVFKAEASIIELLKQNHALVHHADLSHSYPHCWRTKTPLIYRSTSQWFVSMSALRDRAISSIDTVEFTPEWGRDRLMGMIQNRPDWCISRQRFWGVPIPLFFHRETGEIHPDTQSIMAAVADQVALQGIDAWFDSAPSDWLQDSDVALYEQSQDILDVWFDSGCSHFCVGETRDELSVPADLYLEGSDQHRGWFQSSLLTSVAMTGKAPYKGLLTHGFTVDHNGHKMSKSKGNVVSPQKICNTMGADVLRLWVMASDYRQEMNISDEIMKHTADAYRRIRNTARFMLSNLYDFNPDSDCVDPESMVWLDRWAVAKTKSLQDGMQSAFDTYRFHTVYQELHNFCTVDLGGFYFDILKDRLYTCKADGLARRSAQTALYHMVEAMSRWLAPFLSFTADEIWTNIPGERSPSVLLETWYDPLYDLPKNTSFNSDFWDDIQRLKSEVSKHLETLRKTNAIGSSLDAELDLYVDESWLSKLSLLDDELRFVLITSYARVCSVAEKETSEAIPCSIDGVYIHAYASKHSKCARSWHHRADVGACAEHPDLDQRSILNLYGKGEVRNYA